MSLTVLDNAKKKILESYLLSDDRKQVVGSLGINSPAYIYLNFINDLNQAYMLRDKERLKPLKKILEDLQKDKAPHRYQQWVRVLDFKYHIIKIDIENTVREKEKDLDYLNKTFFGIQNNYVDPKRPWYLGGLFKPAPKKRVKKTFQNFVYDEIKQYTDIQFVLAKALSQKDINKAMKEFFSTQAYRARKNILATLPIDDIKDKDFSVSWFENGFPYVFELNKDVLFKYCKAICKMDKDTIYSFQNHFHKIERHLSVEQMGQLYNKFGALREQQYFNITCFRKKFFHQINKINASTNPAKIAKNYFKIYTEGVKYFSGWFVHIPDYLLHSFKWITLMQYLRYSFKDGKVNKDKFFELLNIPVYFVPYGQRFIKKTCGDAHPSGLTSYLGITKYDSDLDDISFVKEYLLRMFYDGTVQYNDVKSYFDETWIRNTYIEIRYMLGQTDDPVIKSIAKATNKEYKPVTDEVILRPATDNKTIFDEGEEIKIKMMIKNCPTVDKKVFRIDTIKYYKQFLKEVQTDINLDGLIAFNEEKLEFKDLPDYRITLKDYPLDINPNKRGVFIVDFIGNLKSCRIVIKRGQLRYITEETSTGLKLWILNHKNQICAGPSTGVMIDKVYYPCNPTTGEIDLGFSNTGYATAILIDDDFAELIPQLKMLPEHYTLKTSLLMSSESMIRGNISKLLFKVNLYLNNRPVPFTENHRLKCIINAEDVDGQRTNVTYENVEVKEGDIIELDYKVECVVKTLLVHAYCDYYSKTAERTLSLESVTTKTFNTDFAAGFVDLYLRKSLNGYHLFVLGKNGEPKRFIKVNVHLFHRDYEIATGPNCQLQSDDNGMIDLGNLEGFDRLFVEIVSNRRGIQRRSREWDLRDVFKSAMDKITIFEDTPLRIPIELNDEAKLTPRSAYLVRVSDTDEVIDNLFQSLTFTAIRGSSTTGYLEVKLPKGSYRLEVKKYRLTYNIMVLSKKETVNIKNAVVRGQRIIENIYTPTMTHISALTYDATSSTVKCQIENPTKETKVVILAKTFKDSNSDTDNVQLYNTFSFPAQYIRVSSKSPAVYLFGRTLSEEYSYVLDRKNAKKYPGNSLEKPTLLLKRMFIQDTKNTDQQAKKGDDFAKKDAGRAIKAREDQVGTKSESQAVKKFNPYVDFLYSPGKVYGNLQVSLESGLVTLTDISLKAYNLIEVYVYDGRSVMNKEIAINTNKVDTRYMATKTVLNEEKGYTKKKAYEIVKAGTKYNVDDIINSEYVLFESLEKFYRYSMENQAHAAWGTEFKSWEFLLKWPSFTTSEQLEFYNNYKSHELNLFLFFKDRAFFNKIVRPYIANKLHKDLVDGFLLNIPDKRFFSYHYICTANLFELVLISLLTKDPTIRARILNKMQKLESEEALLGAIADPTSARRDPSTDYDRDIFDESSVAKGPTTYERTAGVAGRNVRVLREKTFHFEDCAKHFKSNMFWVQLVKHICGQQYLDRGALENRSLEFLPSCFPKQYRLFETILMMSFMDIPLRCPNGVPIENDGNMGINITAPNNLIIYRNYFCSCDMNINNTVIVLRKIFFVNAIGSTRNYLLSEDKLLVDVIYGCDIIVANLNSIEADLDILFQVPQGSVPISSQQTIKLQKERIGGYQTKTFTTIYFYFPSEGSFVHAPAYVSSDDVVVAKSEKSTYAVFMEAPKNATKEEPVVDDKKPVTEQVNTGSKVEVLKILETKPLLLKAIGFNFYDIYHHFADKDFYTKAIKILKDRKIFEKTVYSFSVIHKDFDTLPIYLEAIKSTLPLGNYFISDSLKWFPEDTGFRYLDYYPLVNQRAHKLGKNKKILNDKFKNQYNRFLRMLCEKPFIEDADKLWLIYYFLLLDKIDEAIKLFDEYTKNSKKTVGKLQYDYMRCFMDFYKQSPGFEVALSISDSYVDYPVSFWRKYFENVNYKIKKATNKQLSDKIVDPDEVKFEEMSKDDQVLNEQNKLLRNTKFEKQIQKTQKSLDFTIKDHQIVVNYYRLSKIEAKFYKIDFEILFSKKPFDKISPEEYSYIKSYDTMTIELNPSIENFSFKVPPELANENLFVILKGDDEIQREQVYYKSNLVTFTNNKECLLEVYDPDEKPLPLAYVKVYYSYRNGGPSYSFKDGYTDFRGRFRFLEDKETLGQYQTIKMLVHHESHGYKVVTV